MARDLNIAQEIQLMSHGLVILSGMAKEKHFRGTLPGPTPPRYHDSLGSPSTQIHDLRYYSS